MEKKDKLIETMNPGRIFFNKELFGEWPPENAYHRKEL